MSANRPNRIAPKVPVRPTGRAWWVAGLAGVVGIGVGVGLTAGCSRPETAAYAATALPSLPDLSGKPAPLRERLVAADAEVRRAATPATVTALARLYHANGYLAEAEKAWSWLRAAQPKEPRWPYYVADLRRTMGDYETVEALLNATVALDPHYAAAWLQLAQLQFKTGRLDLARHSYERRLALLPGDPYARLGLARIALQSEQRDAAQRQLEELVRDAPKFPPSRNLYAEMLALAGDEAGATRERFLAAAAGRYREADDPWLEELQADCYDPKRLAVLGTIDFQTNHGDLGRADLERALALAPDDRECAEALSTLYLKLGDVARAEAMLDATIPRVKPPDAVLYVNRCEIARLQQKPEEALRRVREALAVLPEAFQLHNELGAILGDLRRLEESVAAYREAIARAPTDTDSNYSLGITLLALGRREEGVSYIKRSLTLQPSFPKALIMLGQMELEAGNLEESFKYLRPLYELHQDQEHARQLMGQWHLRAGLAAEKRNDRAGTEENYRAGFAIDPTNATLAVNLGTFYVMQGRPAEALAPLEAYHRARPDEPQSALFLGQTYAQLGRIPDARRILAEGERLATKAGKTETASYCREILNQL